MYSAYRSSVFNGLARFAKTPVPEHAVCLAVAPKAESASVPPGPEKQVSGLTGGKFQEHFIEILDRVLQGLGDQDEETTRVIKRIRQVLLAPSPKRQALPYFCSPRYSVETNFYRIEGKDVTIVACLPGAVPTLILYPFGGDIIPGLEQANFELTVTDSEGKTGVAQAELRIRDDEIAYITFPGFWEIQDPGARRPASLSDFVLPVVFSGRYRFE